MLRLKMGPFKAFKKPINKEYYFYKAIEIGTKITKMFI